jgi:hypothetical protein
MFERVVVRHWDERDIEAAVRREPAQIAVDFKAARFVATLRGSCVIIM